MKQIVAVSRSYKVSFIVDNADAPNVERFKWGVMKTAGRFYIRRYERVGDKYKVVLLHRELLCAKVGAVVDHINGDTLDNRRTNLRLCTYAENSRNAKLSKANKSGYKGVSWNNCLGYWQAKICVNWHQIHLGWFKRPEDAYLAYCKAANKYHKDFARLS